MAVLMIEMLVAVLGRVVAYLRGSFDVRHHQAEDLKCMWQSSGTTSSLKGVSL